MNRPDFIITPRTLLENDKITHVDMLVYGYIYWFSKMKNEQCTASNETLASLCRSTAKTVQNSLNRLEKEGYIRRIFAQTTKKTRLEIIPLIVFRGSPVDDTGSSGSDTSTTSKLHPAPPVRDQNKNNIKRIVNKKESNSNWLKKTVSYYTLFWKDLYDTDYEVTNWGKLGKLLLPLSKLNEWQIASLIWVHFGWHGSTGTDTFAHKRLDEAFFPLEWIPNNVNQYKTYLINSLDAKWDDEEAMKKFILPELKKAGYEEKKLQNNN